MIKRIIQFTQLGKFGRFGNQLFQYAFARAYAEKYDATLEIPSWIGEKVFKNVCHHKPSRKLPRTGIDCFPNGKINIDLFGYCQKQEYINILSEAKMKGWFQFQDKWLEFFNMPRPDTVFHIRRGDYSDKYPNVFCVVSEGSYIAACKKFGVSIDDVIWKREENQIKDTRFPADLMFLPDFFDMIKAKNLFRANSTFSFWAGFFSHGKVYSPLVDDLVGECDVEFVEGNWPRIVSVNPNFIIRN